MNLKRLNLLGRARCFRVGARVNIRTKRTGNFSADVWTVEQVEVRDGELPLLTLKPAVPSNRARYRVLSAAECRLVEAD